MRGILITALAIFCWAAQAAFAADPASSGEEPVKWQSTYDRNNLPFSVIRKTPDSAWQNLRHGIANFGFSRGTAWLKGSLNTQTTERYTVELSNPILEETSLYIEFPDGTIRVLTGDDQASEVSGQYAYHNRIFTLPATRSGETLKLYLRLASSRPLIAWPRVFREAAFRHDSSQQRLWIGIYGGMFFTLSLLSLMMWISTQDTDYFDFLIFIATGGLLQAHILGLLHEQLAGLMPWLLRSANILLPLVAALAYAQFARRFLCLSRIYPAGDRIMRLCMLGECCILPLYLLTSARIAIPSGLLMASFTGIMGLFNGFVAVRRNNRAARFYVVANSILVAGGYLHVTNGFHLFDPAPWVIYIYPVCAAFNVIVIAFALADKVQLLQRARVQAQQDQLIAEQQMVEVLRESESALEARVTERTTQLEEALQQQRLQRKTLERTHQTLSDLHEERGAFLQIAAHDLKNPTAAIISYAELLRDRWQTWDEEKKLKRIGNIRTLAQLSFDIIRNLLDINAMENGHFTLHPQRLDAAEELRSVCDTFRERAAGKDIHLILQLPQEPLYVMADRIAVHQIADNLISNAVKYSPIGSKVHLRLAIECGQVLMEVRDEGPGISEDDQTRLFRKFTRLSARPTGGEHSTGLGLSIVKHIAEASAGHAGCISRLGEGSTFYVSLPIAD